MGRTMLCSVPPLALLLGSLAAADDPAPKAALRRPSALALADDGRWLFAANRRSGTITVIDTDNPRPVAEVEVGRRLSDLALAPGGGHVLATDEGADELVILGRRGPALEVAHRLKVGATPVSVQVAADGSRGFVASLWSRQLVVVDLAPLASGRAPRVLKTIPLPFAPRCQIPIPGAEKLVVADAFGGRLAVIDTRRGEVESSRALPAHNIRGLALGRDGRRLLVTHQVLNARATTAQDDVHWGNLMTNNLRSLSLAAVLDPAADLLRDGDLDYLGDVGHGTADPSGLAVAPGGEAVIALAGVGEVAVGGEGGGDWQYLAVGRRPTAVVASPDGRRAYVASTHGDSIAVVDLKARRVGADVALGPRPSLDRADRGELLFYDARLSLEGWLSCQSCHGDGHTNGLLNDNLSDGSFGTPKRVLSLLGVKDTGPWAWDGSVPDLESQVRRSITSTMQGRPPSEEDVRDLAAFLRTLSPPPPLQPRGDEGAVDRGRSAFAKHSCGRCHTPPAYTSGRSYRVGLVDEAGKSAFNPPSLRGVAQGGPYFHDNRAATLEEVFTRHRHQIDGELTRGDLEDLLAFLRSL
jgi:DNA-binding beta-propeller fold protein YncE